MASVRLQSVSKRFGDGPLILDRISLDAAPGDFISLIGPSGCGKSTLLRLVSGLSPATSGRLEVNGHAPGAGGTDLAYVFQEATLLPWLTVAKNVEVLAELQGVPKAERRRRRDEVLEQVRLGAHGAKYPRQLSGGQKMRVSIARALMLDPEVLLLDEPFGALDEMTRDHLNEELLEIRARRSWTAFFVTHSVAEAVFLSNRILILASGPGRLHREVTVDLPYPRTASTRQSRAYLDTVAEVSALLREVENLAPAAP